MPTVFASAAVTVTILFVLTMASMLFPGLVPGLTPSIHMYWGMFVALVTVFLQTMVFGFLIGSGKSVKRVVGEEGLEASYIERTKDHKNRSYPAIMYAILAMVLAASVGAGVSVGLVPKAVHLVLILVAFGMNVYSFYVSWRVVSDDVAMMHEMNRRIDARGPRATPIPPPAPVMPAGAVGKPSSTGGILAFVGVSIGAFGGYFRWVLGIQSFPGVWFVGLGVLLFIAGWILSKNRNKKFEQ